jgi:subtilisin-like proprotein convertase family protein
MKRWKRIGPALLVAATGICALSLTDMRPFERASNGAYGSKPASLQDKRASVPVAPGAAIVPHGVSFRNLPMVPEASARAMLGKRDAAPSGDDELRERSPIPEAEAEARRAAAMQQPVDATHVQQLRVRPATRDTRAPASPGADVLNLLSAFDGPDISQCCSSGAEVPPDPHLAVGPDHVIATVNSAIGIYGRQGQTFGVVLSDDFFNSANCQGTFDPSVEYDEGADRFIINYDASPNDCIAVSQSGDPTGAWNVYAFATGAVNANGDLFDYPHIGVGDQAIYVGANMFFGNFTFAGRVWALNKAQMYAGVSLTAPTPHDLVDPVFGADGTPTPMVLHGSPSAPGTVFIVSDDPFFSGDYFGVWKWTDPSGAAAPTLVGYADLAGATGVDANFPVDQTQLGTAIQIQANDVRTLDAEWRNGHLWLTHQMSCNIGAGPQGCARWAEVDPGTAAVVQAGIVAIFGKSVSFPNLAVDADDNMALGFTVMGPSERPSVYVAARMAADVPGTLREAVKVRGGATVYVAFDGSPNRWGDYTAMAADPDGKHLWYLGEYSKSGLPAPYVAGQNGNWGTVVQQIGFGPDDHLFAGSFDPPRAAIELHAETNLEDSDSQPGPAIATGDARRLRYVVLNTGQQKLHDVLVSDDDLGIITCPANQIEAGGAMICDVPASPMPDGQQINNASVDAVADDGTAVAADNATNSFGVNVLAGIKCTTAGGSGCPEPLVDAPDPSTNGTVTSQFNISGCNTIDGVNVGLSIDHTWVGDLVVQLKSPGNTTITLLNAPIAGQDNCSRDDVRALLSDSSPNGNVDQQCAASTPSIFGLFQPSMPLSAFNGQSGNGVWVLTVKDVFPADTGTLNDWSLQLTCH